MSREISWLLCKLGFHKWVRFMQSSAHFCPQRQCVRCQRVQSLYRGAGADDWIWEDK